ncbi:MAG: hypothetical protein IJ498_00380 [Akkermansia sp.]|nr:hypothetical protein [Akkermansia sp.]
MTLLLPLLCAVALTSCQTAEQQMVAALEEREKGFDAPARYADYLKRHGEYARRLRKAAAEAATMRVHIKVYRYPGRVEEYLPLSDEEVKAAREILGEIEEAPARDFSLWLVEEYDSRFGPQPAPLPYSSELELVSADGRVLETYYSYDAEMGDTAKAEEYRISRYRPGFMLLAAGLKRWNELDFIRRAGVRTQELYNETRTTDK